MDIPSFQQTPSSVQTVQGREGEKEKGRGRKWEGTRSFCSSVEICTSQKKNGRIDLNTKKRIKIRQLKKKRNTSQIETNRKSFNNEINK